MARLAMILSCLVVTFPALSCIAIGTHEEPIPPDALSALKAKVGQLGYRGHVPDVWSRSDDDLMPSAVSVTEDLGEPERGVHLVRAVTCFYGSAWDCDAKMKRYLDYRGNRVEIDAGASAADARQTLASIESLVRVNEHRDGGDDFLAESDVLRLRSLVWNKDQLLAALADGGPCGAYLAFEKQCIDGTCRLEFRGFR